MESTLQSTVHRGGVHTTVHCTPWWSPHYSPLYTVVESTHYSPLYTVVESTLQSLYTVVESTLQSTVHRGGVHTLQSIVQCILFDTQPTAICPQYGNTGHHLLTVVRTLPGGYHNIIVVSVVFNDYLTQADISGSSHTYILCTHFPRQFCLSGCDISIFLEDPLGNHSNSDNQAVLMHYLIVSFTPSIPYISSC